MKDTLKRLYAVKDRLAALAEEYGPIALAVWFTIFGLAMVGFYVAIENGFRPDSAAGTTGTVAMAYAATKVTTPLRLVLTLVITPVVARVLRVRRAPVVVEAAPTDNA